MRKKITISHLLKMRPNWVDATVASLLVGIGVVGAAPVQGQCRPATPAPCAADGMCYPNRNTWGSYTTNWRPFPGDTVGVTPTPETEEQRLQSELPPFIVPGPEQEDLRGPVRPTRPVPPTEQPAVETPPPALGQPMPEPFPGGEAQPAAPAAEEGPGPFDDLDLPGFGPPQGRLQPLPTIEDGPPALPSGLSRALAVRGDAGGQTNFAVAQSPSAPTATANASPQTTKLSIAPSRFVTPAANNIELTNPAAMNVQKTMDQDLEQAIYYEASDMP